MKLWYLTCSYSLEYAVVFAEHEQAAFKKLKATRKLEVDDIGMWNIEEFTEETYDGVLYLC